MRTLNELQAHRQRESGVRVFRHENTRIMGAAKHCCVSIISNCKTIFFVALMCVSSFGFSSVAWAQQGPEVSLDVTELVSDIQQTRSVATGIESSLAEALQTVKAQTDKLKQAGCTAESTSKECRDFKNQLRTDYLAVLGNIEGRLPSLRTAVKQVVGNIETRMGQQRGTTASEVQNELLGQGQSGQGAKKPALQGVSGSRLSNSLSRLQSLVSTTSSPSASFRTIQADLYLDMRESLVVIENLSADIQRTKLMAELQLGDIQVGDEEKRIAEEAQRLLLGNRNSTPVVPGPVPDGTTTTDEVRSPLEM